MATVYLATFNDIEGTESGVDIIPMFSNKGERDDILDKPWGDNRGSGDEVILALGLVIEEILKDSKFLLFAAVRPFMP